MGKNLQLEDFFITKLRVEWGRRVEDESAPIPLNGDGVGIALEVMRRKEEENVFALQMRACVAPPGKKAGYCIDAEIVGLFRAPDGVSDDKMRRLVRTNGAVILYGILRGEIASFTGSFLGGKYVLPTAPLGDKRARASGGRRAKESAETPEWSPGAN